MAGTARKFIFLLILLIAGIVIDCMTKRWATLRLQRQPQVTVIEGFVEFSYTENDGMVFGLLSGTRSGAKQGILLGLTCVSILYIVWIVWRIRQLSFFILAPFFLILSGALSNLFDRIGSAGVVDFIHIHWREALDWPYLFNVADALITIGGFILVLTIVLNKRVLDAHFSHRSRRIET